MTVTDYPSYTQSKDFRSGVEIETNLVVEDTTRMSVDSAGAAHIMSLLTDLYSDPEGSVLREYISNAFDSHAAAGQTLPVEVTLPGAFDPTFIVKDQGTGMSSTEVREIYGSYGKSTKRNDFSQIGAFGLGCKSALTMTQQFTLLAVKNGRKTVAIIARGEDGVGEIKIISSDVPTEEPNGVTVKIPIKNVRPFNDKAKDYFFALPKGSLLVDGKEPEGSLFDQDLMVIDSLNTYISRNSVSSGHYYSFRSNGDNDDTFFVIMGGVRYGVNLVTLESRMSSELASSPFLEAVGYGDVLPTYSIIPVASIDLTPSREGIRYSDRSIKFLVDLISKINDKFVECVSKDISTAPSREQALRRLRHFEYISRGSWLDNITWNGEVIPRKIPITGYQVHYNPYPGSSTLQAVTNIHTVDMAANDRIKKVLYVEGPPDESDNDEEWEKFRTGLRRDFKGWLTWNESPVRDMIIFRGKAPDTPWFTELKVYERIDPSEIAEDAKLWRKQRRADGAKSRVKNGGSSDPQPIVYPTFLVKKDEPEVLHQNNLEAKEVVSGAVYYWEGTNPTLDHAMENHNSSYLLEIINALGLFDTQIIIISKTRKLDAFFNRVKDLEVVSLLSKIDEKVKDILDKTPEDSLTIALGVSRNYNVSRVIGVLKNFTPFLDEIGDPHLEVVIEAFSDAEEVSGELETLSRINGKWYSIVADFRNKPEPVDYESVIHRYPLLDFLSPMVYNNINHAVLYMTAVNSLRKDA